MINDKKISQLPVRQFADLLESDYLPLFSPAEADPAAQNQRATLASVKQYFGGVKNHFSAQVDPVLADDASNGYVVGSHWINIADLKVWVCVGAAINSAEWREVALPANLAGGTKLNADASRAPVPNDDAGEDYAVGSHWVWAAEGRIWICVGAEINIAIWVEITGSGVGGGGGTSGPLNNWAATAVPDNGNDAGAGYAVGSHWLWPAEGRAWLCTIATFGAANWLELTAASSGLVKNNFSGGSAPTVSNDNSEGYAVGSMWLWPAESRLWICVTDALTAAVWWELGGDGGGGAVAVKHNWAAGGRPLALHNSNLGYSVGSMWSWGQRVWHCHDASVGAAVWVEHEVRVLRYLPFKWDEVVPTNSSFILGFLPDDGHILDVRVSWMLLQAPSPAPLNISVRINDIKVSVGPPGYGGVDMSARSALLVEDLGATISTNPASAGDEVSVVLGGANGYSGLEVLVYISRPIAV